MPDANVVTKLFAQVSSDLKIFVRVKAWNQFGPVNADQFFTARHHTRQQMLEDVKDV